MTGPASESGEPPATDTGAPTAPPPRAAYTPPGEETVHRCPDCERPFPDAELLALHRGLEHDATLPEADRETVASARETERRRLRLFRLRALAVLVVLYFGLLILYALVT